MAKVVHIVLDQKFVDNAISIFDAVPGIDNEYLMVSRSGRITFITAADRITVFPSLVRLLCSIRAQRPDVLKDRTNGTKLSTLMLQGLEAMG